MSMGSDRERTSRKMGISNLLWLCCLGFLGQATMPSSAPIQIVRYEDHEGG